MNYPRALFKPEPEETYSVRMYEVDGVSKWFWRDTDIEGFRIAAQWDGIRDALLRHTPGRDVIVQAGGCCGMYPLLWSKYFKTVHTFEPVYNNFVVLCKNCPSGDIHKHHCALGDSNDPIKMIGGWQSIDPNKDSVIGPDPQNCLRNAGMYWVVKEKVESGIYQLMLDQLQLEKLDAMQLDVEEYEIHVLRGAIETIKRCSPTICVETYDDEVRAFLGELGYRAVEKAFEDTILVRQ